MTTVKPFLETYCLQRELPPPTQDDISSCAKMINNHFKYYWSPQFFDEIILPDCGFLVVNEGDKKMVVYAYPEIFKPEMAKRIDIYFLKKNNPQQPTYTPEITQKKRKRIPAKSDKVFSVKSSQIKSS